jgi:hypothetical protein
VRRAKCRMPVQLCSMKNKDGHRFRWPVNFRRLRDLPAMKRHYLLTPISVNGSNSRAQESGHTPAAERARARYRRLRHLTRRRESPACEALWGELPPTWRSTARVDGISGIRLFRVPTGMQWLGQLPGGDAETVHSGHRYCMAWPSRHPALNTVYRWWTPEGTVSLHIPTVGELALLPPQWLIGMKRQHLQIDTKDYAPQQTWTQAISSWPRIEDVPCKRLQTACATFGVAIAGHSGSRHTVMAERILDAVRLGDQGHAGLVAALTTIRQGFIDEVTADNSRTFNEAFAEVQRAIDGAVAIVRGKPTWPRSQGDPCELVEGMHADDPLRASASISGASSWLPRLDLAAAIAGENAEDPPCALQRLDGQALWYPGRVNGLLGPSESGKSWLAFEAMRQMMTDGKVVWLLDFEDSLPAAVERLRTLGVADETMRSLFLYSDPSSRFDAGAQADVLHTLKDRSPALVVLDGTNAAMSATGYDLMSNVESTAFYLNVLKPLTVTGAVVVNIDHTPKNDTDRESHGGIGAQAKRAMTDGAALRVEVVQEFGRGTDGIIHLYIDKDRPGFVRGNSVGKLTAIVTVQSGEPLKIALAAPPKPEGEFKPTTLMDRVVEYLSLENSPVATNTVVDNVEGRRAYILQALKELVAEGTVKASREGRSTLYEIN